MRRHLLGPRVGGAGGARGVLGVPRVDELVAELPREDGGVVGVGGAGKRVHAREYARDDRLEERALRG